MTEMQEIRAWSLFIVSILNNEYKCEDIENLLSQKLLEDVENYIKDGKKEEKQIEGVHQRIKKVFDVNIKQ